jgi:hypothetical protein
MLKLFTVNTDVTQNLKAQVYAFGNFFYFENLFKKKTD